MGDPAAIGELGHAAGLDVTDVRIVPITLHAPSIDDYVATEVESTPLIARISEQTYRRIREDARTALAPFRADSGALALPMEVYFIAAQRR